MIERYDYLPISKIWTDEHRFFLWLQIEIAFLKSFRGVDIPLPEFFSPLWIHSIREREMTCKHDVAAFVEWMEESYLFPLIGEEARFVHYGLTSSDIIDTAFSMQIRESEAIIIELVDSLCNAICDKSMAHEETDILGRTHGQAAEIFSLRNKLAPYEDALDYFTIPYSQPYYGRLRGSIGDQKYFTPRVEENALDALELLVSPLNDGQIIHRSLFADHMNRWAILASIIEKIATDIRLLAQTEIGELHEGFSEEQTGSSSMPHKQNPILTENLCGLARTIRGYQVTAMQNIALWNERDISHSSAERMIFPDAVILLGFMLHRLTEVFENLVIDEKRIAENINQYGKSLESQKHMLALIDGGSTRKEAHTLIKNITQMKRTTK